ncbi:hypothetical protein HRG_009989 [Hirsutella rhossiliensis]|uniref:Uncharacterized protein n=1 Tax=Hirsutella rhossiliensis TaxID=111463 RepID=A0A9P8MPU3_9HYPO|nr:uncharacterized protein HRG_09989 [Hirsutella rhossiliensis]KAH0958944.1 hypothetical protein HRG_09989 [Hirsutella rhossiliensis]
MVRDYCPEDQSVDVFDFPQPPCKSKLSSILSAFSLRKRQEKEEMRCVHISAPIMAAASTPTPTPTQSGPANPKLRYNTLQKRQRPKARKDAECSECDFESDTDDDHWG